MKIVSKFSDYYDIFDHSLVDPKIVYNRTTRHFTLTERRTLDIGAHLSSVDSFEIIDDCDKGFKLHFCIVGFCGELIPCVKYSCYENDRKDKTAPGRQVNHFAYTQEQLETLAPGVPDFSGWFENFHAKWSYVGDKEYFRSRRFSSFNQYDVGRFDREKVMSLFKSGMSPVFILSDEYDKGLIFNPCLRELEFFKLFPIPAEVFQKILIFLSNELLVNKEPEIVIEDKVMAASKGFGHKYAFRKEPSKKK